MKTSLIAFSLLATPLAAEAADPIIDHAAIDRQIEAFTGVSPGSPGGATAPIDRRLRLSACAEIVVGWRMPRREALIVECRSGIGWKFFVPVIAAAAPGGAPGPSLAAAPLTMAEASGPILISRGDVVTLEIRGGGFTVSQSGTAMENGAAGAWIKVKPTGKNENLSARVVRSGLVTIPAA